MNGSANLRSTDHETEATVYITNWQESWDLNSDHILSEKDSKSHLCIQIQNIMFIMGQAIFVNNTNNHTL